MASETRSPVIGKTLGTALGGLDYLEAGEPAPGHARDLREITVKGWAELWPRLLGLAMAGAVWELAYLSHWKSAAILPSPAATFTDLWHQMNHSLLWQAVGTTLKRAVTGYGLALVIGSVIGAVVSRNRPLRAAVGSLITALQTMPSIAWFPFAIIFFGISTPAILFVMVLGAAPSIANGLVGGVDHVPPLMLRAGRMIGAKGLGLYRHVILPAALPTYVAGLKQGWAFAWRSLMAGELLVIVASRPSIGAQLQFARDISAADDMMAMMIVILVIGIVVDTVFGRADVTIRRRWGLIDQAS